jgi:hypothetical protein
MISPLSTAPGGFNRVLVAIDKLTKWIEVKPVTCPKADRVLDFLDELVHHYGLPHHIITDLGSNFDKLSQWTSRARQWTSQWTSRARQWDGTRRSQEATARRC